MSAEYKYHRRGRSPSLWNKVGSFPRGQRQQRKLSELKSFFPTIGINPPAIDHIIEHLELEHSIAQRLWRKSVAISNLSTLVMDASTTTTAKAARVNGRYRHFSVLNFENYLICGIVHVGSQGRVCNARFLRYKVEVSDLAGGNALLQQLWTDSSKGADQTLSHYRLLFKTDFGITHSSYRQTISSSISHAILGARIL